MRNTKTALFIILLLGLIFIPVIVNAQSFPSLNPLDWIKSTASGIVNIGLIMTQGLSIALVTISLLGAAIIFSQIAAAINLLLGEIIQQTIQVKVLPGSESVAPFVTAGWNFTRNLVNVFLLFILAVIGLATILRIQDYSVGKILPRLFLVALLVNFSGVFVAFIVDISNIFTNFFISKVTGFSLGWEIIVELLQKTLGDIINIFKGVFNNDPLSFIVAALTPAANALVIALFFIVLILVLFATVFVFIMRVVMLWILTILAPLAFALSILPPTRRFWNDWLKQLLQWTFIGIPLSFFLWLSALMMKNIGSIEDALGTSSFASGSGLTNVLASFLAPIAAITTLAIGVMLSLALAPSGAARIARIGGGLGASLGVGGGSALWRKKGKVPEKLGKGVRKTGDTIAERGNQRKNWLTRNLHVQAGKSIGRMGGVLELASKEISTRVNTSDNKQIDTAKEESKKLKTPDEKINRMKQMLVPGRPGGMNAAIGYLEDMIENGNPQDLRDAVRSGVIDISQINKVYDASKERGDPNHQRLIAKGFFSHLPDLEGSAEAGKKMQQEISAHSQPEDFEKNIIAPYNFDTRPENEGGRGKAGQDALDSFMMDGDADNTRAMFQAVRDPDQRRAMLEHLESKGLKFYIENGRENIPIYFLSQAARNNGLRPLQGMTREDIEKARAARNPESDTELKQKQGKLEGERDALRVSGGTGRQILDIESQIGITKEKRKFRGRTEPDLNVDLKTYQEERDEIERKPEEDWSVTDHRDRTFYQDEIERIE